MARAIAEMRDLGDEELIERLESSKEELFNLRFQLATGQLDNPMRIKQVRHDVARILTVLREREIEVQRDESAATRRPAPKRTVAPAPKPKAERPAVADVEAAEAGDETEPEGVEAAADAAATEEAAAGSQPKRRLGLRRKRNEDA